MDEFNLKKFYNEESLSSMKLNDKISMSFVFQNLKDIDALEKEGIKIVNHKNNKFEIHYKDIKLLSVFEAPIKIEIKNKIIEIINLYHLNQMIIKYKYINPKINCKSCNAIYDYDADYIKKHKNHNLLIIESDIFLRIKEEEFDEFFNKEKKDNFYLGTVFGNPEEFEKNFQYYFKDYEIYKNKLFQLYNDGKRREFLSYLEDNFDLSVGRFMAYFGQSGRGKSISIITYIKYNMNHDLYGTLYLNMKCLNVLSKEKKYNIVRQILIDEIPYLFYKRYNDYVKCSNLIVKFLFENSDSIWELISKIIDLIFETPNNQRLYIFIFDQYNDKIDNNKKLNLLSEKYIKNNPKRILGIISVSSMNNDDIKEYKIDLIREKMGEKFESEITKSKTLKELEDIYDIYELRFIDDLYEEYFESLGRDIKYYNKLMDCLFKKQDIDDLMKAIKEKIIQKIKLYLGCDKDEKNITNLLYFSTTTKYNLDKFLNIVKYVPFKYFIPKVKKDTNNNNYIKIDFAFPLIEEIVNELFENIFYYELNIYTTLSQNETIDGGARGQMFEKLVTFHLDPKSYNPKRQIFFKDIFITDTVTTKMFIPRENEEIKERKNKLKLKRGTYLFKQKILTGKDLDILIVTIDEKNIAHIISLQITIHKPNDKIFTEDYLKKCIYNLTINLGKLYDFYILEKNIYFAYIFDKSYEKKDLKSFNDMINKCKNEKMAYMIFDPEELIFFDKNGEKVEYIENNVCTPSYVSVKRSVCSGDELFDNFLKILDYTKKSKDCCDINPFQIIKAIKMLRKNPEFKNVTNIEFCRIAVIPGMEDFNKERIYFGRTSNKNRLFMLYFSKFRNKYIHEFLDGEGDDSDDNIYNIHCMDEYVIKTEN